MACPPMRSNVNLSRIVRAAGCCGVRRMICCGNAKVIGKIARDAAEAVRDRDPSHAAAGAQAAARRRVCDRRPGADDRMRSRSSSSPSRGGRCWWWATSGRGIEEEVLRLLDHAVEIPVYGMPYAHNAATAAAMALYEYCRQYPRG